MTRFLDREDEMISRRMDYITVSVSVITDVEEDTPDFELVKSKMVNIASALLTIGMSISMSSKNSVIFDGDVKGGVVSVVSVIPDSLVFAYENRLAVKVLIESHNSISKMRFGTYELTL